MAEKWGQQQGFNFAVRLGHLAIKAHGVVIAQRLQSIQRMAQTHTRSLMKLPGSKRKLEAMAQQVERVNQIIKERSTDGE
jgi:hypothetical protein